ncbi:MAG: hypothetical protein NTV21_16550 [Planctomycetota bacterium]|nr:hypothetical protein [Planctomycetota bacterium]
MKKNSPKSEPKAEAKPKPASAKAHPAKSSSAKAHKPTGSGTLPPEAQLVDEGELEGDVLEFVNAIDTYKRDKGRQFPAWSEVLQIVKSLGYRKGA